MVIQSLFVLKRWLFFCRPMCAIFRGRVNIRHWPAQRWFDELRQCWRGLTSGLTNAICRSRLKAGNRYNERRRPGAVGHCEHENAPRKMQPYSRQRFISVIQLLVSFRETLAACSTPCRREYAALSWSEIPAKIPPPFHISHFCFIHRYSEKN